MRLFQNFSQKFFQNLSMLRHHIKAICQVSVKKIQSHLVRIKQHLSSVKVRLMPFWIKLSVREQYLITGLGVFLIYSFGYMLYSPLSQAVAHQENVLKDTKYTLAWMEKASQVLAERKKHPPRIALTPQKADAILRETISNGPFSQYVYDLKHTSQYELMLSFDVVPYQTFLKWLLQLEQDYILSIQSLRVDALDEVGLVKLQLMISVKS